MAVGGPYMSCLVPLWDLIKHSIVKDRPLIQHGSEMLNPALVLTRAYATIPVIKSGSRKILKVVDKFCYLSSVLSLILALITIGLVTDWDKLVLLLADSLYKCSSTILGSAVQPRSLSTELLFSQLFCMAARNCTDIIH